MPKFTQDKHWPGALLIWLHKSQISSYHRIPQNIFLNKAYAMMEGTCERPYTRVTDIWGQTQQKTSAALTWEPPPSSPLLPHTAMYSLTVTQKDLEIAIKPTVLLTELASTFQEPDLWGLSLFCGHSQLLSTYMGACIFQLRTLIQTYSLVSPSGNGSMMLKLLMAVCGMWGPPQLGYCTWSLPSSGWSKNPKWENSHHTSQRCHFPHPKLNTHRLSQGLKEQSLFLQHQRKC